MHREGSEGLTSDGTGHSTRIPDGIPSDSGFNKNSKNSNGNTTSSLSAAQRGGRADEASLTARIRAIPEADALTRLVATLRPAWDIPTIRRAIERDDRPWMTVVAAYWRGALDPDIAHPNGLRYIAPVDDRAVPRLPTPGELDRAPRCPHGAVSGTCALCRNGVTS